MKTSEKFKQYEGRFDVPTCVRNECYGGIYAKQMVLPKGYFALSHKHNYDHLSILAKGECTVITDQGKANYSAPAIIKMEKERNHEIVAITDVIWYCLHNSDKADDEILIDRRIA